MLTLITSAHEGIRVTYATPLDKVKVKLPLCLTKHHAMKMYWRVEE